MRRRSLPGRPRPPVVVSHGSRRPWQAFVCRLHPAHEGCLGEAGGIHAVYRRYLSSRPRRAAITFLDTPGHAASTAMRNAASCGAGATDVVVLIIAGDDGNHAANDRGDSTCPCGGCAIVVAVNKMDKPDADLDRVRQELALETDGHSKTGQNISCWSRLYLERVDQLSESILQDRFTASCVAAFAVRCASARVAAAFASFRCAFTSGGVEIAQGGREGTEAWHPSTLYSQRYSCVYGPLTQPPSAARRQAPVRNCRNMVSLAYTHCTSPDRKGGAAGVPVRVPKQNSVANLWQGWLDGYNRRLPKRV